MEDNADIKADRWAEFGENYVGDDSAELGSLIIAAGNFLELLVGDPDAVDKALRLLYELCFHRPASADMTWRELWEMLSIGDVKTSEYFASLNAFAFFGLPFDANYTGLPEYDGVQTDASIARNIKRGRDLLTAVPPGWADTQGIESAVLAAEARNNLDFGRCVSIEQIAALARMTPKSIRNLLTPKSGESDLRLNSDGLLSAADALRWLSKRPDYKSSIWMWSNASPAPQFESKMKTLEEAVFIPAAKDGTTFDAVTCRTSRGYTIGPKGAEQLVEDYFEALRMLAKASTPQWRRPNDKGHWGIVTGVSWLRRDAVEIHKVLHEQGA